MAPGRKTGGRKKGTPNKQTAEMRALIARALESKLRELPAILDETRYGIEIEKTLEDGKTVTGRLNADPKGAGDLIAKFARFCVPELGKNELTGPDGGPLEVVVLHETRKDQS